MKYAASEEFRNIMKQILVNAKTLAEELNRFGFRIVSGTTDNHIVMVDLRSKGISGKLFQSALDEVGITVNKNQIPLRSCVTFSYQWRKNRSYIYNTEGIKKEAEVKEIAEIMNQVAAAPEDKSNLKACREKAETLIARFPLYPAGSFED